MLFKSFVTFTVLANALAAPLAHQHHQHKEEKRAVHVVTQTNVVVVTIGNGEQTTTFSAPTVAADSSVSVSVNTQPPQNHPTTTQDAVSASTAPASTDGSAASPSSTESGSEPSSGVGSGGAKGITYSPYSDNGGCKSSSQIASEVAQLSGFDIIRLYGVDCDQVSAVLKAKSSSQKIFAGIFDVANIESGIKTLADAVKSNGGWDDVYTVSIGNELVNAGSATPSQIKSYVEQGKKALQAAGYNGPVVSVDTFIAVINNPELCDCSDYMAVNAHAFFDGHVAAEDSGAWVLQQIQRVWTACGGKKNVLITETGWPSKGDSNGVAVPSKSNQQAAVSSIKSTCGDSALLFTAFNDFWKADGPYNAEKYWGIYSN
ncbi:cell surface mannoprotein, putative [Candida dubliniensis CD36]|uniref:Cell surface mannoprotein, putative n=1 Tax=Candida dubliniensis (strain CD36 / ATCC MYA-646 / CBS 7987 / NCPF 3949 / NRRL Y-17841) TaxID=573826 RepID=B9WCR6_CANDC|nr:cell surface mannoprotein, putative [Candida dubliniensis CD36]CAX44189.1 cell surface mannoprotein, putative [Candida dubliniensis CD36]